MHQLGTIVRLQVQRASPKMGLLGVRRYNPAPIQSVPFIRLSPRGVIAEGDDGIRIVDVHHRDHPESRLSRTGKNAVSLGFSPHYGAMRARFGSHLHDGVAGENILIHSERRVTPDDLAGGLVITVDGESPVTLQRLLVAEPCVEFTRYALRREPDVPADDTLQEALAFLREGMRGFYATYAGDDASPEITIRVGDRVFLPER